jgi:hypothetical protein
MYNILFAVMDKEALTSIDRDRDKQLRLEVYTSKSLDILPFF